MCVINKHEKDMIREMLEMQDKLDEEILKVHNCAFDLEKSKLALIDELGEMNHENKASWCWWKFTQAPVDREKLLEELVDVWHFALSINNHTNGVGCINDNILVYSRSDSKISHMIASMIEHEVSVLAWLYDLTLNLGFSIDDIYKGYINKNKVNYERLKKGY